MKESTSFLFVEGYLAAKISLEFDWSIVRGLDWIPHTLKIDKKHLVKAHE